MRNQSHGTHGNSVETNPCCVCSWISAEDDNVVEYIHSIKGGLQLCVNGFPYTRHRVGGQTTYWRCVQFRPLKWVKSFQHYPMKSSIWFRFQFFSFFSKFISHMVRCKARVRIKADGTKLEIVERYHNHGILTERRKKGVLKALYNEKRKFNLANLSWQIRVKLYLKI